MLIFKHLPEGPGTSWDFLWKQRSWQEPFAFFPYLASAGRHAWAQPSPTALPKPASEHSPPKGCPFINWPWWPGQEWGTGVKEATWFCNNWTDNLGRLPPSEHCRQQAERHIEFASEKGLFTAPRTSTGGTGFRFAAQLLAAKVLSGNIGRHTDQWNRTESPGVNPGIHGQLTYDKVVKNIQWENEILFNNWCWDWTITCKSRKPGHYLAPFIKFKSKCINDLNV